MNDTKYWIWLNSINNIGPIKAKRLLEYFKTPKDIWNADKSQLSEIEGIGQNLSFVIESCKDEKYLEDELNKIKKKNIEILTLNDDKYPANLKNIYDPPILLFVKGNISSEDNNAVAIVGSRKATHYGLKAAYELAKQLAQKGITVISGMAKGIDTAAHKGALDAGGRTIAVLGCGLDIVYPYENRILMNEIIKNGAVVTEYPLGTAPEAKNFPRRNRIISGISLGTIIVEASQRSGSLITADFALEQNREVFAVPGQIYTKQSEGTNNLIKQGAKLVTSVEDVLEELNIKIKQDTMVELDQQIQYNNLSKDEKMVFENISNLPIHLEEILNLSHFTIDKLNIIITTLELKGLIKQLPGKVFIRI